jgi:Dynein heavy chain AAA lid domain
MHYCADTVCEFVRLNCKQCVTTGPNFLVNNMIHVIDTFVQGWNEVIENKKAHEDPDAPVQYKTPKDAEEILNNALVYALIWGIGAQLEETTRNKYNAFLLDLLMNENVCEKYNLDIEAKNHEPKKTHAKMPNDLQNCFDFCY